ncbi:hypothetical protein FF011L_09050 [Roseimaritima multifibrata]|uniref:Uncharacterized protein n=1 Tax=Roseimaritima multifibrata TaxID=1930274 RepID=A0A517MB99_9BACT|nr:hypothetical protein [Roseimaritima multifibrata]QDS92168.1 hypothetical protein FF011L_09050 [Roseimaritima multifibrata]
MSDTNPQIEQQLKKLAEIVCQSLDSEQEAGGNESEALLKALLMSGYARQEGVSLQADLESRVKEMCSEPGMHRGGELSGITQRLQSKFDKLARWESRKPEGQDAPKAANFSSATDS